METQCRDHVYTNVYAKFRGRRFHSYCVIHGRMNQGVGKKKSSFFFNGGYDVIKDSYRKNEKNGVGILAGRMFVRSFVIVGSVVPEE